jgi:ribose 5-phosphate isomerase A
MNSKQTAGEKAIDFVEDGMIVGLGTGSTAYFAIKKIAERVGEGMSIKGICTSEQTRKLAEEWNIPYVDIDEVDHIDLTIDGADEVDPMGNGIKGGGGALLLEKIVASRSLRNIWVLEERKLVNQLGAFPLPVEIMPFGHLHTIDVLKKKGFNPKLRKDGDKAYTTDGGHFLVDLQLESIPDPFALDIELKTIPGVLEHGLFLDIVNDIIVARCDQADVIAFR